MRSHLNEVLFSCRLWEWRKVRDVRGRELSEKSSRCNIFGSSTSHVEWYILKPGTSHLEWYTLRPGDKWSTTAPNIDKKTPKSVRVVASESSLIAKSVLSCICSHFWSWAQLAAVEVTRGNVIRDEVENAYEVILLKGICKGARNAWWCVLVMRHSKRNLFSALPISLSWGDVMC